MRWMAKKRKLNKYKKTTPSYDNETHTCSGYCPMVALTKVLASFFQWQSALLGHLCLVSFHPTPRTHLGNSAKVQPSCPRCTHSGSVSLTCKLVFMFLLEFLYNLGVSLRCQSVLHIGSLAILRMPLSTLVESLQVVAGFTSHQYTHFVEQDLDVRPVPQWINPNS